MGVNDLASVVLFKALPGVDCRAGSSANNLALLNFEYLAS